MKQIRPDEQYLKVSLPVTIDSDDDAELLDEMTIDIWGYSWYTITLAREDIMTGLLADLESRRVKVPAGCIYAEFKVFNLAWQSPQIGNYPPPNVEVPGYWEFDCELLGFTTLNEDMDDVVFIPVAGVEHV